MTSQTRAFADTYNAHLGKYGSSPIEDGTIGKLADNECKHGALPSDAKRICDCFSKPKAAKR